MCRVDFDGEKEKKNHSDRLLNFDSGAISDLNVDWIHHQRLIMFSFEGNYKRTPSQNLGGASASSTNDRDTLIRRAQLERQKRADIRKQHTGAITIQSYVRSFLARIKCKNEARTVFDQYLSTIGLTNPEQLEYLLRCILFFYDNRNEKDGERLVSDFLIIFVSFFSFLL